MRDLNGSVRNLYLRPAARIRCKSSILHLISGKNYIEHAMKLFVGRCEAPRHPALHTSTSPLRARVRKENKDETNQSASSNPN